MKNVIQMIDDNTFRLVARGSEMTLERADDGWTMTTINASVRAWNNGFAFPKRFANLAEVEANYKTWRGIEALVNAQAN